MEFMKGGVNEYHNYKSSLLFYIQCLLTSLRIPLIFSPLFQQRNSFLAEMMGFERLMVNLKTKLRRSLKMKESYDKIEKSESMRVEIRSKKARKLIEQTLKIADSPKSRSYPF
ncbi:hypothetical protein HAX54_008165 [Datura stramonium]|uniref:Uncharacterized protein n=1 Tax=Datura stramonium TaxID=4076 RepID=A0ABS8RVA2_DATST|nr:hypothetical protein [Datura stramonium]